MRGQINDHGSAIGGVVEKTNIGDSSNLAGGRPPHSGRTGRWTTDSACLYGVGHFRRIPVLLKVAVDFGRAVLRARRPLALLVAARPPKALCRISKGGFLHRPDKEVGRLSSARQHEGIARQLGDILWLQKQLWPIGLSSSGE